MKRLLVIAALFISLNLSAQKVREGSVITVTNFAWDCGTGYNPKKAYVIKRGDKLLVKFDFKDRNDGSVEYYTVKKAFEYWRWEETKIVKIKY